MVNKVESTLEKRNTKQSVNEKTRKVSLKKILHSVSVVLSMLLTCVLAFAVGLILCVEEVSKEWKLFDTIHYTFRQFLSIVTFNIAVTILQLFAVAAINWLMGFFSEERITFKFGKLFCSINVLLVIVLYLISHYFSTAFNEFLELTKSETCYFYLGLLGVIYICTIILVFITCEPIKNTNRAVKCRKLNLRTTSKEEMVKEESKVVEIV